MKKVAIIYNHKDEDYEVHHYNILFRIFGANIFTYIDCGLTKEKAIQNAEKQYYGKLEIIEISILNNPFKK